MTLICSIADEGFFAISDILTSAPGAGERVVTLPLHIDSVSHPVAGYSAAGVAQKAIIFGRTLILWAGLQVVAEMIARECFKASRGGEDEIDLFHLIDSRGLNINEIDNVKIIYHYRRPGAVSRQAHGAEVGRAGIAGLMSGGSGQFDFIDNLAVELDAYPLIGHDSRMAGWLTRLLVTIISEAYARRSLDYSYGGWYELVLATETGFRKVPISVKLWTLQEDGGVVADQPVWFSWYAAENLNVTRLWFGAPDGRHKVVTSVVTDPLRRTAPALPLVGSAVRWEPELQWHVLIKPSDGKVRAKFISVPPYPFRLTFSDEESEMIFEDGFAELLAELLSTDSTSIGVERPYDG